MSESNTTCDNEDFWSSQEEESSEIESSSSNGEGDFSFFQSKRFWQGRDDSSTSSSSRNGTNLNAEQQSIQDKEAGCQEGKINSILKQLHQNEETLVNVEDYLSRIENALLGNGKMFSMAITEQHRKTMLKTLLGIHKVELESRLDESKRRLQHERIVWFLQSEFQPLVLNKQKNDVEQELMQQILVGLDQALRSTPTSKVKTALMARGALYKGNFVELLKDVAPELVDSYLEAKYGFTEQDIRMSMVNEMKHIERREAVEKCIQCPLPPANSSSSETTNKQSGLECERKCLQHLCGRYYCKENASTDIIVVQNVMVKTVKSGRQKPSTAASFVSNDDKDDNNDVVTGIIETPATRKDGTCEEFDALVVEKCNNGPCCVIREVWEAKASINPSTLHDAIHKKLPAMQSLVDSNHATLCLSNGQVLPIKPLEPFLFGLYGTSVQPVDKAANQARTIACNRALAINADAVVQALNQGHVEIDCQPMIQKLAYLRMQLAACKWMVVMVEN